MYFTVGGNTSVYSSVIGQENPYVYGRNGEGLRITGGTASIKSSWMANSTTSTATTGGIDES